ncbi:MAG: acyltransferase family protein, partial [Acidimicrobiia bacterium]
MAGEPSIRHIPALDGLRGAAICGVLLFHGGHLTGGFLGVDLFFVLSGFLITSLLLVEAGSRLHAPIRLGAFWARRARRLLPALGGLLVGIAVYAVVFARPTELAQIRGDALATVFYGANWRAVGATHDYWSLFSAPSPLQHTWSLAIEEQFYLVWPLVFVGLLAWCGRAIAATVFVVATLGALGSAAAMWLLFDPGSTARAYYGTDTRAAGILLGAALAGLLRWRGSCRGRLARIGLESAGLVAFAGLVIAWTRLDGQATVLYRGGLFACGLAAVVVIAAAVHPVPGPIARVLSWRPLCLLGLV